MIREIIKYPMRLSSEYGVDVRVFNEEIFSLLEDLKDTINQYNLEALSAFQIGSYYNLIVFKQDDGSLIELLNPRLISAKGKMVSIETTAYFPNITAKIDRYDQISIVYQDRYGNNHSISLSGERSAILQRKLDYNFGATFLTKMSKDEKKEFEKKLEFGSDLIITESCPTTFKRDYLVKGVKIFILIMFLILIGSFFVEEKSILETIFKSQIYLALCASLTNIGYFFYAHYEAKKYTSCISCQSGNIIGTTLIGFVKILVLFGISYIVI